MSSCSDLRPLSQSFLDCELAESELRDFESHLTDCQECRAAIEDERQELAELRAALAPPAMPIRVRDDVLAAIDREDADELSQRRRSLAGWTLPAVASVAAAAALVLFVVKGGALSSESSAPVPQPLAQEAVRQNLNLAPIVASGSRHEVSRSAEEYLRAPVRAPRFSRDDVALLGWQPGQLSGHEAAVFRYETAIDGARNQVSVHVIDAPKLRVHGTDRRIVDNRELWVDSPFGYSSVTYQDQDGLVYVFTSEMSRDELVDLVAHSDILHQVSEHLRR